MPKLTVEGVGTFDVPQGKRLVLALEDEAKVVMQRFGAKIVDEPPTAELIAEHKAFGESNLRTIFKKPFSGVTTSIVLYEVARRRSKASRL